MNKPAQKRILSIFLVLMMLLTVFPSEVLAATDTDDPVGDISSQAVEEPGDSGEGASTQAAEESDIAAETASTQIMEELNAVSDAEFTQAEESDPVSETAPLQTEEDLNKASDDVNCEIIRLYGNNRYLTSQEVVTYFREKHNGGKLLSHIILASGIQYPDALAGSFLADALNSPILLADPKNVDNAISFIKKNVEKTSSDGFDSIYILGGTSALPSTLEKGLSKAGYSCKRVAGKNRYATNREVLEKGLEILEASGREIKSDMIVSSGVNFADALGASGAGLPILLVDSKASALTDDGNKILRTLKEKGCKNIYVLGGQEALPDASIRGIESSGMTVTREAGKNRYETAYKLASALRGKAYDNSGMILVYGGNFPDGLSAGILGCAAKQPVVLVSDYGAEYARKYFQESSKGQASYQVKIIGGTEVISHGTVRKVIGRSEISTASPSINGRLSVNGTQLVDQNGDPVQLKGISTHGLAWFPQYVNQNLFNELHDEWGANVVRLAMYTAEYGGYCSGGDQKKLKELIRKGVSYAQKADMYVIIDWHILSDNNPLTNKNQAVSFFREMCAEFANEPHVLYEICNEPNGGTSWAQIKSYASSVIPVIREKCPDSVILVGTPNWCQFIEQAASDPIPGVKNVMYTLHFYAATHKADLRNAMSRAIDKGLPVFVSEYGICDASGSGGIDYNEAAQWVSLMDEKGVSYVMWNLSNKAETSSVIASSCGKVSGFSESELSAAGRWLLKVLSGSITGSSGSGSSGSGSGSGSDSSGSDSGSGSGSSDSGGSSVPETPADIPAWKITGTSCTGDGLTASGKISNKWQSENAAFIQVEVEISNAGEDVNSWETELTFEGKVSVQNAWCCNYTVEGNTIRLTNADFNGTIANGGKATGIGLVVKCL